MPSHTTYEAAINRGYSSAHWVANQCAEKLAGHAAKEVALSGFDLENIKDGDQLSFLILNRLVDVVSHAAPDNTDLGSTLHKDHVKPRLSLSANGRGKQGTLWMESSAMYAAGFPSICRETPSTSR